MYIVYNTLISTAAKQKNAHTPHHRRIINNTSPYYIIYEINSLPVQTCLGDDIIYYDRFPIEAVIGIYIIYEIFFFFNDSK